jgi:transcriptional regulator with XRE-family HTH domain
MSKNAAVPTNGKTTCLPLLRLGIFEMMAHKGVKQIDIKSISQSYVSRIISGERYPTIETLEGICHHCGVDMIEFFGVYMKPFMSSVK